MATGSKKTLGKKMRLAKAGRRSRSMPTWIVMRTNGKIRFSPHTRREWRSSKLDAS